MRRCRIKKIEYILDRVGGFRSNHGIPYQLRDLRGKGKEGEEFGKRISR